VPFGGGETWYRVTGDLGTASTPLVVLHGGPGMTHNYVLSLTELARNGRPVIHYDQVGCGNSTHYPDRGPEFFTVGLFLEELDAVLAHLGIGGRYHLLGQSWGGMLAAEHAVLRPPGLRSVVLSNSPASMLLWVAEANRLRKDLPADVREALDRHEQDGTTDDPEYVAATQVFYDRHVCRSVPNPDEVRRTFELNELDPTVYHAMNGPNEFFCIGSLKEWSIEDRVQLIQAPTLLVTGAHDEATPATVQPFFDGIPDVRWAILEESSHMPFVEEPDRYFSIVDGFLVEHD